jgi:hypothetical protein
MSDESDHSVVCSGAGLFTETASGRRVYVAFRYLPTSTGGMVMQMTRADGSVFPWPLSPEQSRMIAAFFFPKDSGDGQPARSICDPINIDRSRRNQIRDALARRALEVDATAAD